jgi:hypothetical protein
VTSYDSEANRWRQIKSRYDMTPAMYSWLLDKQGGVCGLCGLEETFVYYRSGKTTRYHIEHAHKCECDHGNRKTQRAACVHCIRGIVCAACNRTLLPIVERSSLLRARFADYLDGRPLLEEFSDNLCGVNNVRKQRQLKVASLRRQGLTFREIADELSVTHSTAVRDWQACQR